MKITDITASKATFSKDKEINKEKPADIQTPKEDQSSKIQDKVQLSLKSTIERAQRESSHLPEVREDKVAQLKERIQSGQYQVSDRDLARAMISSLISEIA
ncbi:MAG: flagellar biosynthesis anti-sigma factor FlgM [Caldimicrobium sp.]|nr:flagellar biosynthesis anti-sigma factor FlgM [Caldimicrobium sp.]MCX7613452.1 flagellar biosynthesis anti-sigma factor FlgM [Caldimicrobium sp.]MDW8182976.1 flagellar biosynthesis anti-sigma factor FlgM [Caldimicrobium sp.]